MMRKASNENSEPRSPIRQGSGKGWDKPQAPTRTPSGRRLEKSPATPQPTLQRQGSGKSVERSPIAELTRQGSDKGEASTLRRQGSGSKFVRGPASPGLRRAGSSKKNGPGSPGSTSPMGGRRPGNIERKEFLESPFEAADDHKLNELLDSDAEAFLFALQIQPSDRTLADINVLESCLRRFRFFCDLGETLLEDIARVARFQKRQLGDDKGGQSRQIYEPDDQDISSFYVILKGSATLARRKGSKQPSTGTQRRGLNQMGRGESFIVRAGSTDTPSKRQDAFMHIGSGSESGPSTPGLAGDQSNPTSPLLKHSASRRFLGEGPSSPLRSAAQEMQKQENDMKRFPGGLRQRMQNWMHSASNSANNAKEVIALMTCGDCFGEEAVLRFGVRDRLLALANGLPCSEDFQCRSKYASQATNVLELLVIDDDKVCAELYKYRKGEYCFRSEAYRQVLQKGLEARTNSDLQNIEEVLTTSGIFEGTVRDLGQLAEAVEFFQVLEAQTLFKEGEAAEAVFAILSGTVRLFTSTTGSGKDLVDEGGQSEDSQHFHPQNNIAATLGRGAVIGTMSETSMHGDDRNVFEMNQLVKDGHSRAFSAITSSDAEILRFPMDVWQKVIESFNGGLKPSVAHWLPILQKEQRTPAEQKYLSTFLQSFELLDQLPMDVRAALAGKLKLKEYSPLDPITVQNGPDKIDDQVVGFLVVSGLVQVHVQPNGRVVDEERWKTISSDVDKDTFMERTPSQNEELEKQTEDCFGPCVNRITAGGILGERSILSAKSFPRTATCVPMSSVFTMIIQGRHFQELSTRGKGAIQYPERCAMILKFPAEERKEQELEQLAHSLANTSFFEQFPFKCLLDVCRKMTLRTYENHQAVFEQGEEAEELLVVLTGLFAVHVLPQSSVKRRHHHRHPVLAAQAGSKKLTINTDLEGKLSEDGTPKSAESLGTDSKYSHPGRASSPMQSPSRRAMNSRVGPRSPLSRSKSPQSRNHSPLESPKRSARGPGSPGGRNASNAHSMPSQLHSVQKLAGHGSFKEHHKSVGAHASHGAPRLDQFKSLPTHHHDHGHGSHGHEFRSHAGNTHDSSRAHGLHSHDHHRSLGDHGHSNDQHKSHGTHSMDQFRSLSPHSHDHHRPTSPHNASSLFRSNAKSQNKGAILSREGSHDSAETDPSTPGTTTPHGHHGVEEKKISLIFRAANDMAKGFSAVKANARRITSELIQFGECTGLKMPGDCIGQSIFSAARVKRSSSLRAREKSSIIVIKKEDLLPYRSFFEKMAVYDLGRLQTVMSLPAELRAADDLYIVLRMLKQDNVFRRFEDGILSAMARRMTLQPEPRGNLIFCQGHHIESLYFVVSGQVALCQKRLTDHEKLSVRATQYHQDTANSKVDHLDAKLMEKLGHVSGILGPGNFLDIHTAGQANADVQACLQSKVERSHTGFVIETANVLTITVKDMIECLDERRKAEINEIHQFLSTLPPFAEWKGNHLHHLASLVEVQYNERGQVIFEQNAPADCIYFLLSGECSLYQKGQVESKSSGNQENRASLRKGTKLRKETRGHNFLTSSVAALSVLGLEVIQGVEKQLMHRWGCVSLSQTRIFCIKRSDMKDAGITQDLSSLLQLHYNNISDRRSQSSLDVTSAWDRCFTADTTVELVNKGAIEAEVKKKKEEAEHSEKLQLAKAILHATFEREQQQEAKPPELPTEAEAIHGLLKVRAYLRKKYRTLGSAVQILKTRYRSDFISMELIEDLSKDSGCGISAKQLYDTFYGDDDDLIDIDQIKRLLETESSILNAMEALALKPENSDDASSDTQTESQTDKGSRRSSIKKQAGTEISEQVLDISSLFSPSLDDNSVENPSELVREVRRPTSATNPTKEQREEITRSIQRLRPKSAIPWQEKYKADMTVKDISAGPFTTTQVVSKPATFPLRPNTAKLEYSYEFSADEHGNTKFLLHKNLKSSQIRPASAWSERQPFDLRRSWMEKEQADLMSLDVQLPFSKRKKHKDLGQVYAIAKGSRPSSKRAALSVAFPRRAPLAGDQRPALSTQHSALSTQRPETAQPSRQHISMITQH